MGDRPVPRSSHGHQVDRCLDVWLIELDTGDRAFEDMARDHNLIDTPGDAASDTTPRRTAHAALRLVLAGYVGMEAARQPFDVAPGGKPSLPGAIGSDLAFSLAHCTGAALVAVSRDGPVGVDIETSRRVRIADHRRGGLIAAAAALSPEWPLPGDAHEASLLQAWTRLEALAKATGEGIGAVLERVRRSGTAAVAPMVAGRPIHVRDVTVACTGCTGTVYAAIAGRAGCLAGGPPPAAVPFPADRAWIAKWLDCGNTREVAPHRRSHHD